ncbi:hypothetical protein [Marinobacter sp. V034]|uniref:hypothetical protein n=1 Tax=Marinobacter sp. V034 TaxID=3459610 RepID=UPI0040445B49
MKYLLRAEDVADDPEFLVALMKADSDKDVYPDSEEDSVYVPERVMERILGVGSAYNLQFTKHAPNNHSDRWAYSYAQLEWIIDELGFLQSLLNDQLLNDYLSKILGLAAKARHKLNELELIFEGP